MQEEVSYQSSLSNSAPSKDNANNAVDPAQNYSIDKLSATKLQLRSVMSQHAMETLTSWFPKSAQALAAVLRTRLRRIDDER